jgi:hypothetical protein
MESAIDIATRIYCPISRATNAEFVGEIGKQEVNECVAPFSLTCGEFPDDAQMSFDTQGSFVIPEVLLF